MKRTTRALTIPAVLLTSLVAAPALRAQIGPWGDTHPAWVDLNGNGTIDAGEVAMYPTLVYNSMLPITDPDALYIVLVNNPWDACPNHIETRINASPLFDPTTMDVRHGTRTQTVTSMGSATAWSFTETLPAPVPRKPGPLATMVTAAGTGNFIDTNSDGVYDMLRVGGTQGFTMVPSTDIGFVFRDVNADGKADYVSFPWAMTGVLGIKQSGGCLGGGGADPQIWLPTNDTNSDGRPDTVSVRIPNPQSPGTFAGLDGIPIIPFSQGGGGILAVEAVVPTLPVWGLLALSVALAAGGVFLLRGRMPGFGA